MQSLFGETKKRIILWTPEKMLMIVRKENSLCQFILCWVAQLRTESLGTTVIYSMHCHERVKNL